MGLPEGSILLTNSDGSGYFFHCRSVPPPYTNLVFIFQDVCSRSGYIDVPSGKESISPTCPITECPHNRLDDESLLAIRADYRIPPVANQRGHDVPPEPLNRIRTVYCETKGSFAIDDSFEGDHPSPLSTCPFCGEELARLPDTTALSGRSADAHAILWQTFDPPITRTEAEVLSSQPDPNVAPMNGEDLAK